MPNNLPEGFTIEEPKPGPPEGYTIERPERTWSSYATDIPSEAWKAEKEALKGTYEGLLPASLGGTREPAKEGIYEGFINTGKGLGRSILSGLAAAPNPLTGYVPPAAIWGATRTPIAHAWQDINIGTRNLAARLIGEDKIAARERELGLPVGGMTFDQARDEIDRATMAIRPSAGKDIGTAADLRARPEPAALTAPLLPPDQAARIAQAQKFGIGLSRGDVTQDQIQLDWERRALAGELGMPAQHEAKAFAQRREEQIRGASAQVQGVIAGQHPLETSTPGDIAENIGMNVGQRAEAARQQIIDAETAAKRESEAMQGMVEDRSRALQAAITKGQEPTAGRADLGDIISEALREAEAKSTLNKSNLYRNFFRQPGNIHAGVFEGMGTKIKGDLSYPGGDAEPFTFTERTAPRSSDALEYLNNKVGQFIIPNAADPLARRLDAFVNLRGLDQVMKELNSLRSQAYAQRAGLGSNTDVAGMNKIIAAFEDRIQTAIKDPRTFQGDPSVMNLYEQARAAAAEHFRLFRPQTGNAVANLIDGIVEGKSTPEKVAVAAIGSGTGREGGTPVMFARALRNALGTDSESWNAVQQTLWREVSQVKNAAGEVDPLKSAARIEQFAGEPSTLAREYYPPEAINAMREHAVALRELSRIKESPEATTKALKDQYDGVFKIKSTDIGSSAGQTFQKIIMEKAGPNEIVDHIFNVMNGKTPDAQLRAIRAIEAIYPESANSIRQAVWLKLTEKPDPKALNEFLNGKGKYVAEELYPDEIGTMREYLKALDLVTSTAKRITPTPERQAPNPQWRGWLEIKRYMPRIMEALGLIGGSAISHTLVGPAVGFAGAHYGTKTIIMMREAMSGTKAARAFNPPPSAPPRTWPRAAPLAAPYAGWLNREASP